MRLLDALSRHDPRCPRLATALQAFVFASLVCWSPAIATDSPPWHGALSDGSELALPGLDPSIPTPEEVLGHAIGERFTAAHRVAGYLERLADSSPRAKLWTYGESYEGRPLQLMAISSPENIERLDALRQRHLERLRDPDGPAELGEDPVFVWLSYGVHGNESSSTEAAMATAFVLSAAEADWESRLREVVVLIDPLTNPDGRERYVHFYATHRGRQPDGSPRAAEHEERWPGGRQNHYLIDLNRDWAWLTQRETRQRVAAFRRWEPHVFADVHEMNPDSSYFFPPAAPPVNPRIDRRTVDWLTTFGAGNAAAFERQGWVFYTGEQFDLFYPGYGDSYPSLRGAVGMTYEMAGGGRAGLSLERRAGEPLRLADRTARHLTASLATVETAAAHRERLARERIAVQRDTLRGSPKSYLWPADVGHAAAAAELLRGHGIEVSRLTDDWRAEATSVVDGTTERHLFPVGSYRAEAGSLGGQVLRTLMEVEESLDPEFVRHQRRRLDTHRDTQFYDITAWGLPLAFGLDAWASSTPPRGAPAIEDTAPSGALVGEGTFGYHVRPQGLSVFRFAGALQRLGVPYRLVSQREAGGGGLFIARRDLANAQPESPDEVMSRLAAASDAVVERKATGYDAHGAPYGSEENPRIRPVRIGLVSGPGVSPTGFGHLWHLLDRVVEAPHHRVHLRALTRSLRDFDVLVLPSGEGYESVIDDDALAEVGGWIERGGVLVAIGEAADWLRGGALLAPEGEVSKVAEEEPQSAARAVVVPGAALRTELQSHHPIAAGLTRPPAALFYGSEIWPATGDPAIDLLTVATSDPVLAGLAWPESVDELAGALLVGEHTMGEGRLILFSQDPAFRGFWRATMPLFLNAVLHAPSWP